jgi:hypothetical protein
VSLFKQPARVIFDHLPKCGGSTLNKYLEIHYRESRIFRINGNNPMKSIDDFKALSSAKKNKYKLIKGHLANRLFPELDERFIRVTMLREPIERIVSHYYYAKRNSNHYLNEFILKNDISLKEYVQSGKSEELVNWYVSHFSGFSIAEMKENPADALKVALQNIAKYDLVGLTESFNQFTEELKKIAGFKISYNNQKENVTQGRTAVSEIDSESLEAIKSMNQLDVQFYHQVRLRII